jgi:TRAP-type C4-dicarboxylate transport system substrate-binding protein
MAKGLNAWIGTVQKASNGSIVIDLFTDAQLASSTDQIVNGIKSGNGNLNSPGFW